MLLHPDGDSLLRALDRDQRGQTILSTSKGIWFLAPRTRRALRITPLQALRGDASIGDIMRQRWSDDYDAEFADPHQVEVDGSLCWNVRLRARDAGATYQEIQLYIAVDSPYPAQADLYVASGRLYKRILFERPESSAQGNAVMVMTFVDGVDNDRRTVVRTSDVEERELPKSAFTVRGMATFR